MISLFIATAVAHLLALLTVKKYPVSILFLVLSSLFQTVLTGVLLMNESGWNFNTQNACLVVSWLANIIVIGGQFRLKTLRSLLSLIAIAIILWIYFKPLPVFSKPYALFIDLHITLSILAYSFLFVSSLVAINLALQIYRLKKDAFVSPDLSINSLLKNEEKLFLLIVIGWLFLGLSLLSGALFIDNFFGNQMGHKIIFSIMAWILFSILIAGRMLKGWRGKKAIKLNLIAMALLMIGFLGSYLVIDYIL
ncbi:MAG: hypothetical protein DWP95_01290 [Proteobacteria bacterium]|nr:MAG: hypothetical protein DWP95_01290 [Pseudomonadota bacterium]